MLLPLFLTTLLGGLSVNILCCVKRLHSSNCQSFTMAKVAFLCKEMGSYSDRMATLFCSMWIYIYMQSLTSLRILWTSTDTGLHVNWIYLFLLKRLFISSWYHGSIILRKSQNLGQLTIFSTNNINIWVISMYSAWTLFSIPLVLLL